MAGSGIAPAANYKEIHGTHETPNSRSGKQTNLRLQASDDEEDEEEELRRMREGGPPQSE